MKLMVTCSSIFKLRIRENKFKAREIKTFWYIEVIDNSGEIAYK